MSDFIHLHNHTHYSILDGACTVEDLVKAAAEAGMPAVALTDHGVMFGAVEFYQAAKKRGIKPIIGNELYMVTRGSRRDRTTEDTHPEGKRHGYNHIVLLAKNLTGYRNLIRLTTLGHTEGFYYKPRIDFELLEKYHEGLIALTACAGGVVSSYLCAGDRDGARAIAARLKNIFGDDLYLEIQDHGIDREVLLLEEMPKLARELGIRLVATNDCHYIHPSHAVAHNVFLHIADGRAAEDVMALRYGTDQIYFKSSEEMVKLFARFPQAVESTLEIAEKCTLEIPLGKSHMPEYPIPVEAPIHDIDGYLRFIAETGLRERIENPTSEYTEQLDYELGVIRDMGYSGYFLIVHDFISAARRKGIRVGPGRGSAAGSLVAYALRITDIDPIRYNLLFERFLNPDRISMPDIDVDFQDDRREEVIAYVREKYGASSVSQIVTFNKLSARAVLKDVGRVLGIPLGNIESITKHIPVRTGKVSPLKYALGLEEDREKRFHAVPELAWVASSTDPAIRRLVEFSCVLEGLIRGVGMHAAGVVIAPGDTMDYVPLYKTPSTGLMTMYNMEMLEAAGLLKMDFLGLITLTVIDRTVQMIKEHRGIEVDIDRIPLDDDKTYEMIGEGHTVGVFQFESPQMREYLRKLKPRSIEDLAAMNALYRPGPMQFIDEFIDRKYGRKEITYLHPLMEPVLRSTYGIIIYQEQVMRLAHVIAGFSLAQSDFLRRAMSKKKGSAMGRQRELFIEGAKNRGIDGRIASEIFDMIYRFADYGFNKSHAVAYSLLAYQTAYLKANFTPEYMAALMTSEMAKTDKVAFLIEECRKLGIPVLRPDINESGPDFTVTPAGIRFGLAAIKNVGVGAVEAIVQARKEGGAFTSLFDFCSRVESRLVNKKTLESLVMAGAMDSLGGTRARLSAGIETALAYGQQVQQRREIGQASLFDDVPSKKSIVMVPPLPPAQEWT
ncbi:MAG: DNA polymerase III subunit alpha, partial [Bacteroidota bacterium]|nr:DNA polymerase III subunit alpha [Bacteroidota bacterium]